MDLSKLKEAFLFSISLKGPEAEKSPWVYKLFS